MSALHETALLLAQATPPTPTPTPTPLRVTLVDQDKAWWRDFVVPVASGVFALVGAVVGARAALIVADHNAVTQAERDVVTWERENKRDGYFGATRPLLRVRNRRMRMATKQDNALPELEREKHLDDVDEAQHGLAMLAIVCGAEQRQAIDEAITDFDDLANEIRGKPEILRLRSLSDEVDGVWEAVLAAEKSDMARPGAETREMTWFGRRKSRKASHRRGQQRGA